MNGAQVSGQEVTVASGQEKWFTVNYLATSSGTVEEMKKQEAGKPPEPPAANRPTVPTDAKLFSGKHYKVFNEFLELASGTRQVPRNGWSSGYRKERVRKSIHHFFASLTLTRNRHGSGPQTKSSKDVWCG